LVESGKHFYCVPFSIRSGSTLLCDDLAQWGFGAPGEWFQFPEYPILTGPLSVHLVRMAEDWDGDFIGLKISWYQASAITERLHAEGHTSIGFDFRNIFPGLHYIHIVRRDKISQAVSAWRAKVSSTWHWPVGADIEPSHPEYDFAAIHTELAAIVEQDWLWASHFEQYGISPFTVYYEDYVQDRPGYLQQIGEYMGVEGSPVPLEDRLRIMRDKWTDEIVARVTADLHRPW
jgi:LPS sulfotransferase NodH